jgi:hypothetical protein
MKRFHVIRYPISKSAGKGGSEDTVVIEYHSGLNGAVISENYSVRSVCKLASFRLSGHAVKGRIPSEV